MKEVMEKCDICGEGVPCIYFEDWGIWICFQCYTEISLFKLLTELNKKLS